jgi:hypothetical protein
VTHATKGYVEEALEEAPRADMKLADNLELVEQLGLLRMQVESLEELCDKSDAKISELSKTSEGSVNKEQLEIELQLATRPPAVINTVSMKLHSTTPGSFVGPPYLWETSCGWPWVKAGRFSQPVRTKAEVSLNHLVCKKCRLRLIEDGFAC